MRNGGVITDAISTQDWTGDAAVDVSIVNWAKVEPEDETSFTLDGVEVPGISAALRPTHLDVTNAQRLAQNLGLAFQGPQPVGAGFVLQRIEALELIKSGGSSYESVVRPYLIGNDILHTSDQWPSRYIIDFGLRSLEEAMAFPLALDIVRERVKPSRDKNRRPTRREKWWLLGELVPAMRAALAPLRRYIATSAVSKRFMFVWCEPEWCPSNRTIVVALEHDFHIGVLNSSTHVHWALEQGGTFEDRPHYTHTTTFETFPWPDASPAQRDSIAEAAKQLHDIRRSLCVEYEIGLTELYNRMEDGAYRDLEDRQRQLDLVVASAYGWPVKAADDHDDSNRRLLELNEAITAGEIDYAGPG